MRAGRCAWNGAAPAGLGFQPRGGLFERHYVMSILKWAVIMLLVSLVAALFGFTDLSAASADVARVLFYIFLVIFVVLLVLGMTILRR